MKVSATKKKQQTASASSQRGAAAMQTRDLSVAEISTTLWPTFALLSLMIFLVLVILLTNKALAWLDKPISEVSINGSTRFLDGQVLATELAQEVRAPLLSLDIRNLRDEALLNPWVYKAEVRRLWPAAVEISIAEQVPVARWGDRGLLNHQGDIFWPDLNQSYDFLPRLNGPAHETRTIIAQYHDLSALFAAYGIRLKGLTLESRGAWNIELDNGILVVAGRDQLMPRLRRFISIYDAELSKVANEIAQVDIRYTNGVAVSWRSE